MIVDGNDDEELDETAEEGSEKSQTVVPGELTAAELRYLML